MKSYFLVCFFIFAAAGPALAQSKATQATKQFGWHTNLDGAKTVARQTGKPIFLVFRCDP